MTRAILFIKQSTSFVFDNKKLSKRIVISCIVHGVRMKLRKRVQKYKTHERNKTWAMASIIDHWLECRLRSSKSPSIQRFSFSFQIAFSFFFLLSCFFFLLHPPLLQPCKLQYPRFKFRYFVSGSLSLASNVTFRVSLSLFLSFNPHQIKTLPTIFPRKF